MNQKKVNVINISDGVTIATILAIILLVSVVVSALILVAIIVEMEKLRIEKPKQLLESKIR